jgi:hypothetical protein
MFQASYFGCRLTINADPLENHASSVASRRIVLGAMFGLRAD